MSDHLHLSLRIRCSGGGGVCGKLLGVVDEKGRLVTESSRSGSYIKTVMEKGIVACKNCGTVLKWNAFSRPRATPGNAAILKEEAHHA